MNNQVTISSVCKIMIPFIQVFGLYVIAHGEIGPGGGFQGGVIIGASIILLVIVFGLKEGRKRLSERAASLLAPGGVLLYAGIGLISMLMGGSFLEYSKLPLGSEYWAIHLGVYGIEIGVGITVAVGMMIIFFEMADKSDD